MDTTDRTHRLALPYLASEQAQKHVTVNEGLRALDALVHASVRSARTDVQPASPTPGDAYLLTEARDGQAWSALPAGTLAAFQDGAWAGFAPAVGMTVWVADEARHRVWDGTAWAAQASGDGAPVAPRDAAPRFGVNASASDTNRLTVKSDAVLHTHDDASGQGSGDARHVINKAGAASTASVLFQSGYAGRAELGLTGTDDFALKVSADGETFVDAITIDRTSGAVSLPNTRGGGAAVEAEPSTIARVLRTPFAVTNETVQQPVAELSGARLAGGSVWRVELELYVEGAGRADSRLGLAFDRPDASFHVSPTEQKSRFGAVGTGATLRLDTEPDRRGTAHVAGVVAAGAADTTLTVSWAQAFADAGTSTLHPLSYVLLTRLA